MKIILREFHSNTRCCDAMPTEEEEEEKEKEKEEEEEEQVEEEAVVRRPFLSFFSIRPSEPRPFLFLFSR